MHTIPLIELGLSDHVGDQLRADAEALPEADGEAGAVSVADGPPSAAAGAATAASPPMPMPCQTGQLKRA